MSKQTVIKEYIREVDTMQPRGVVVAVRVNDEILYGYSLLNTTMDRFDKKLGFEIAMHRATSTKGYKLPEVFEREIMVLNAYRRLEERASKYFKDLSPDKVRLMPSNVQSPYVEA